MPSPAQRTVSPTFFLTRYQRFPYWCALGVFDEGNERLQSMAITVSLSLGIDVNHVLLVTPGASKVDQLQDQKAALKRYRADVPYGGFVLNFLDAAADINDFLSAYLEVFEPTAFDRFPHIVYSSDAALLLRAVGTYGFSPLTTESASGINSPSAMRETMGSGYRLTQAQVLLTVGVRAIAMCSEMALSSAVSELRELLYGLELDTFYGDMRISTENGLEQVQHFWRLDSAGPEVLHTFFLQPMGVMPLKAEFFSLQINGCDWGPGSARGEYPVAVVTFCILMNYGNQYSRDSKDQEIGYLTAMNIVNMEHGGLKGLMLNPWLAMLDDKSDYEAAVRQLVSKGIRVFFGLNTLVGRRAIAPHLVAHSALLFYSNDFEDELESQDSLFQNMLYTGYPVSNIRPILANVLTYSASPSLYIVYADYSLYVHLWKVLTETFAYHHLRVTGSTQLAESLDAVRRCAARAATNLPQGGIIVVLLSEPLLTQFFEAAHALGLSPPVHTILSYRVPIRVLEADQLAVYEGHWVYSSGNLDPSTPLAAQSEFYIRNYFDFPNPINHVLVHSISAVLLWEAAVLHADSFDSRSVLATIPGMTLQTPSGEYVMGANRMLPNYMLTERVVANASGQPALEVLFSTRIESWTDDETSASPAPRATPSSLSIGVALRTGDPENNRLLLGVKAFVGQTNGNRIVTDNAVSLDIRYYEYDADVLAAVDALRNEAGARVIFACRLNSCLERVAEHLSGSRDLLMFVFPYLGERCEANLVSAGPLPIQMERTLMTLMDTLLAPNRAILLLSASEEWSAYSTILERSLRGVFSIVQVVQKHENGTMLEEESRSIVESLATGGFVITTLSLEQLRAFMSVFRLITWRSASLYVISLRVSPSELAVSDAAVFEGSYFISGYFLDNSTYLRVFNSSMHSFASSVSHDPVAYSAYVLCDIYYRAYKANAPLAGIDLLSFMHHVAVSEDIPGLMLRESNVLERPMFALQLRGGVVEQALSMTFQAYPNHWGSEMNLGMVCNTSSGVAEQSRVDAYYIALVSSYTGQNSGQYVGLFYAIQLELALSASPFRSLLFPIQRDDESSLALCVRHLRELADTKMLVLVTTSSEDCLDDVSALYTERHLPILRVGPFAGESCRQNVFYAGTNPVRVEEAIEFSYQRGQPTFCLVGSNTRFGTTEMTYAVKWIEFSYGTVAYQVFVEMNIASMTEAATALAARAPDGCTVLFFSGVGVLQRMMAAFDALGLKSSQYPIMSLTAQLSVTASREYYFFGSFLPSVVRPASVMDRMLAEIGSGSSVTEDMLAVMSALELLLTVVTSVGSLSPESLARGAYSSEADTFLGRAVMGGNNIMRMVRRVGLHAAGERFASLLYEGDFVRNPVYKRFINEAGDFTCNFTAAVGARQRLQRTTIAALLPLTGPLWEQGRAAMHLLVEQVNRFNEEDLVLGCHVHLLVRNFESNMTRLAEVATEVGLIEEVQTVFGGSEAEHKMIVSPIMDALGKFYVYLGDTPGIKCFRNTVIPGSSTHQMVLLALAFSMTHRGRYVVIDDGTVMSKDLLESLSALFSQIVQPFTSVHYGADPEALVAAVRAASQDAMHTVVFNTARGAKTLQFIGAYSAAFGEPSFETVHFLVNELRVRVAPVSFEGHYFFQFFFNAFENTSDPTLASAARWIRETRRHSIVSHHAVLGVTADAITFGLALWSKASEFGYSFSSESVHRNVYNRLVEEPTGVVMMGVNGISSRRLFVMRLEDGVLSKQNAPTKPIDGLVFSPWQPDVGDSYCDWSETDSGDGFIHPHMIRLLLVLEISERYRLQTMSALNAMWGGVMLLNANGGWESSHVSLKTIFGTVPGLEAVQDSPDTYPTVHATLDEAMRARSYRGVFACVSAECLREQIAVSETNRFTSFFLGNSEEELACRYVLFVGRTVMQLFMVTLEYLRRSYRNFYIISSQGSRYEGIADTMGRVIQSTDDLKFVASIILNSEDRIDPSVGNLERLIENHDSLVSRLHSHASLSPLRAVFSMMTQAHHAAWMRRYQSGVLPRHNIIIVLLQEEANEILFDPSGPATPTNVAVPGTYFECLRHISGVDAFFVEVYGRMSADFRMNSWYENAYLALNLWHSTLLRAREREEKHWPTSEYFRLSAQEVTFQSPAGPVYFSTDNRLTRPIFLTFFGSGELYQVYPFFERTLLTPPHTFFFGAPEDKLNTANEIIVPESRSVLIGGMVLVALSLACCVGTLVMVLVYRNLPAMNTFSLSYPLLLLLALTLGALANTIFLLTPLTRVICEMQTILGLFPLGLLAAVEQSKCDRVRKTIVSPQSRTMLGRWVPYLLLASVLIGMRSKLDPSKPVFVHLASEDSFVSIRLTPGCSQSTAFECVSRSLSPRSALSTVLALITALIPATVFYLIRRRAKTIVDVAPSLLGTGLQYIPPSLSSLPLLDSPSALILVVLLSFMELLMASSPQMLLAVRVIGRPLCFFAVWATLFIPKFTSLRTKSLYDQDTEFDDADMDDDGEEGMSTSMRQTTERRLMSIACAGLPPVSSRMRSRVPSSPAHAH